MTLGVFAKPVDMENLWRDAERTLHLNPATKVITHVVTAERNHRHRIATNLTDGNGRCRRHFRSHRCTDVHSGTPIKGLKYQRHGRGTPTAKHNRADWYAIWIFPGRIYGRALRSKRGEARVWMCGLLSHSQRFAAARPKTSSQAISVTCENREQSGVPAIVPK